MGPEFEIFKFDVKVLRTISGRDFMGPESDIFRLVKVLRMISGRDFWIPSQIFRLIEEP